MLSEANKNMKRISKLFIFIMVFLIGLNSQVFANSETIKIGDASIKAPSVNVLLNGNKMSSEFSAFILNERTFIPIREVTEFFKADVQWDKATKTATIKKGNSEIALTIDSAVAKVNGVEKPIANDSIPKFAVYGSGEGKTVVPLRLLSELLGYEVGWDKATRTASIANNVQAETAGQVTSIKSTNGSTATKQVKITANSPMDYVLVHNEEHNTVSIDFKGMAINIDGQQYGTIKFDCDIVDHVEYKKLDDNKNGKAIIHLKKNVSVIEKMSDDKKELTISFTNKIMDIKPTLFEGKESIIVSGVKTSEYNIIKLSNPFRYVIDIKDATLYKDGNINVDNVNTGFVKNIRASKFVPDKNYHKDDNIVRIVLDPKVGVNDAKVEIKKSGDDLIIVPSSYEEIITSTILDPDKEQENVEGGILIPDLSKPDIVVREKKKANSLSDIIIMVDAGHGGNQPGTTGINGDLEKELNLDVSLKVEQKLKNLGFTVKMVRTSDKSVDNFKRADMANEAMADIYLSIHANSALNPEATGIEVLYYPNNTGSIKYEDQSPLAKSILAAVVKSTGAKSRGIVQRPDLIVLKNTQMAAALVETGFMSNAEEAAKLRDGSYRDSLAEGIANGIRNYVKSSYGI